MACSRETSEVYAYFWAVKNKSIIQQLGVVLILSGIALRLVVFYQNRSLFIDESNLARNIVEKNWIDFFQILDYYQYAPPLFLCIEKCSTWMMGANEYALRLWPLVAACLSLFLIWAIAKRIKLEGYAPLIPLAWMVFSPLLVRYSTEVKQYSTDVFVGLFLIWWVVSRGFPSSLKASEQGVLSTEWPAHFYWALIGGISVWLSMPSVFVLAGIGLLLVYEAWQRRANTEIQRWLIVIGFWLINFAGYYFIILSKDLDKQALIDYHSQYFFPLQWYKWEAWLQAGMVFQSILRSAFGFTTLAYLVGGLGLLWGLRHLWQTKTFLFWLLLSPILICLAVSSLGFYSLIPRLTLFFIPLLWLIFAHAFSFRWEKSLFVPKLGALLPALGTISLLAILPLQHGYKYFYRPLLIEEIRPVLALTAAAYQSDDVIFVDHEAKPAFIFYQDLHSDRPFIPTQAIYLGNWNETPATWITNFAENNERIWLVYSHLISAEALGKLKQHLEEIPPTYELAQKVEKTAAVSYLYVKKK